MRLPALLFLFSMCSCLRPTNEGTTSVTGYAPVYMDASIAKTIGTAPARPTKLPGRIYVYGSWIFQVDQSTGIHIIDNSDPQHAHKVAFLQVAGATEIAIKGNYLYTNNLNDLVVFDLASTAAPKLVQRLDNAYPLFSSEVPPAMGTYFECPDASKGIVVAWEQKMLDQPKCRR